MSECSFVKGVSSKVINQIRVREEKFGKPIKTDEELSVIHGNCPWVVLRSGIDAPLSDVNRRKVFPREGPKPEVTNAWAKRAVLGGELQDRSNSSDYSVRPAGIQTLPDDSTNYYNSAYRLTEYQGHRPVAGITDVVVKTRDTWGMVFEAEVSIKCWSQDELDVLDRVYFKPGYHVLLEWGHTVYFREDGTKCTTPKLMISDEEFFDVKNGDYLELDQKILDRRKENLNQEAVFGTITNFSFSLNKDGSYDCKLKFLSKNAVVEGLKVKNASQFADDSDEEPEEQDDKEEAWKNRSVWHRIYVAFSRSGNTPLPYFFQDKGKIEKIEEIEQPELEDFKQLPPRSEIPVSKQCFDGRTAILNRKDKKLFKEENLEELKHGFPVLELPIETSRAGYGRSCGYYITLRTLLYLFNIFNSEKKVQFNLWDNASYADMPLVETEKDSEGKYITPLVSLNPYVALKPKQGGTEYDVYGNLRNSPILSDRKSTRNLIRSVAALEERSSSWEESENNRPKILNIWINYGQFVNELDKQIDGKTEDYSILEALKSLLDRIQKAFGNINEFQIVADHKLGDTYLTIIDTKCIDTADLEGRNPPEIQVTGLNNTVTGLTVTSEISSDMANQMSIAAQAPRTYEEGSENTDEAMVHWGENCANRWVLPGGRSKKTEEEVEKERAEFEKKKKKWIKRLKKRYRQVSNTIWGPVTNPRKQQEKVLAIAEERFGDLQLDGERFIHSQLARGLENVREPNLQMGIIPIRAGLTMMGIGNFTVGNVFRMKGAVLLPKYRNWGHIVTGIEHKISRGRWETTFRTQYYPVYNQNDVVVPPSSPLKRQQEAVITDVESGRATRYIAGLDNTTSLYEAVTKYAGYTWGQKHWCARYTAAWARAYVVGKGPLYAVPEVRTADDGSTRYIPPQSAGGNANQQGHVILLKTLGYKEVSRQVGASRSGVLEEAGKCSVGDVLIYFDTGKNRLHSQFLADRGWVSDFDQSTGCVYSGGENYTIIHLKAPARNKVWKSV